jgi:hypothetical protein
MTVSSNACRYVPVNGAIVIAFRMGFEAAARKHEVACEPCCARRAYRWLSQYLRGREGRWRGRSFAQGFSFSQGNGGAVPGESFNTASVRLQYRFK